MKKITLLLLTACNLLLFAQKSRTNDVTPPKAETKPIVYKYPTKAFVTLQDYNKEFNAQNLISPKLYGQQPFITDNITSQEFEAGNTNYTSNAADDFKVPTGKSWNITAVNAIGNVSLSNYPTSYKVTFYTNSATNFPDTVIRTETVTLAAGSTNPSLLLATPLILTAGTYWVSVQAVMDLSNGQWFWSTYNDAGTLSRPFAWRNPGGGFATSCNANWNTASICLPSQLKDLQFSLDGVESNASGICKTFTGRILSTDPTETTRLFRDAVPSICGTTKPYPTPAFAGSFHYKTYAIQNTLATTNCVTVNLTNQDPTNQLHLVAYSGTFNPANIAANYMGDSGSSSFNNSVVTMNITMPANSTMVIVVNETVANSTFTADYTVDILSANCGGILKVGEAGGKDINIYPNPVNTTLFVNGMKMTEAKVFDISGKIIPVKSTESQINVQGLPKGNYLLQLKDKTGNVYQDKFIKN